MSATYRGEVLCAAVAALAIGCGQTTGPPAAPKAYAERTFGALEPWAAPIEDYIQVGINEAPEGFNRAITELMPFAGKLFMGYGDGTYNLGTYTPIEMRAFASPDDPTAAALVVRGEGQGEVQRTPYQTHEEQIDRFRVIDGALWQAGLDSDDADELWTQGRTMPKAIQGNVFRLEGDAFLKFRSIPGGEHVQDVAGWKGAVYAVGSGADVRTEFETGQIFRYLWRSTDKGVSFQTVKRTLHPKPGAGDTRFAHLLPTGGALYLFGYETSGDAGTIINAAWDGQALTDLPRGAPLSTIFPDGTLELPGGTGLVYGLDLSSGKARRGAFAVSATGATTPLSSLAGSTVLDTSLTETGEIIYLTIAGENLGDTPPTSWDVRILVAPLATPDATGELLRFTSDVAPTSVATWQGAIFMGTAAGRILKAVAATPTAK